MKPRLCVDFDGTIFDGVGLFPGCVEALFELQKKYSVAIFSARRTEAERQQMADILKQNGVPHDEILAAKPEAVAYIDDKGIRFEGWSNVMANLTRCAY